MQISFQPPLLALLLRSSRTAAIVAAAVLVSMPVWADSVPLEMVRVGEPDNAPDETALGAVEYEFYIGKFEVTNAQYALFLNAKAAADEHRLYGEAMAGTGIRRDGSPGGYTYAVEEGFENHPVGSVSIFSAMRFVNWLSNGGMAGDTETGAYDLTPEAIADNSVTRIEDWRNRPGLVLLPTADEWYKAAYYDPENFNYYPMPTSHYEAPEAEPPPGGPNSANMGDATADENHPNGRPVPVGAYPETKSPVGAHDMAGNVWEWTEQIVDPENRVARGGSYANSTGNASHKGSLPISPQALAPSIGFRVVSLTPVGEIQP